MDQQNAPPISSTTTPTAAQSTDPSQPPQSQLPAAPSTAPPSSISTVSAPSPTSTPNPNPPRPSSLQLHPQPPANTVTATSSTTSAVSTRPQSLHRPWQHPHTTHFSHFSSLPSASSSSPSLVSSASPTVPTQLQRGPVAIGVPASSPAPSSFGQQFGGLGRGLPESVATTSNAQGRSGIQGMQSLGMTGSISSSSQMRPVGISSQHHQRTVQQAVRPPSSNPNFPPSTSQNFQGHNFTRSPSLGPPSSPATNASPNIQPSNQPWLSSGSQGKPPLHTPSFRTQLNSPTLSQRPHIPQAQHSFLASQQQPQQQQQQQQQQQHMPSAQTQQSLPSHQSSEHHGQQFPQQRVSQSTPYPQSLKKVQTSVNQKPATLASVPSNTLQSPAQGRPANTENDESGNRILGKRSIQELVSQIDPSEKLDSEVEDILSDIADDFIDSITTFGCSLAKHRKSDTLEAKDILLHLERNWNMTLPGFSGDEIRVYKKPFTNDIHKERLAAIKRSVVSSEVATTKNTMGQGAVNTRSNLTKTPATTITPNPKLREVT